jgi:hypothetical protein
LTDILTGNYQQVDIKGFLTPFPKACWGIMSKFERRIGEEGQRSKETEISLGRLVELRDVTFDDLTKNFQPRLPVIPVKTGIQSLK